MSVSPEAHRIDWRKRQRVVEVVVELEVVEVDDVVVLDVEVVVVGFCVDVVVGRTVVEVVVVVGFFVVVVESILDVVEDAVVVVDSSGVTDVEGRLVVVDPSVGDDASVSWNNRYPRPIPTSTDSSATVMNGATRLAFDVGTAATGAASGDGVGVAIRQVASAGSRSGS